MLDRPIFVIGTGRSGSTAFFNLFAKHDSLAWLTGMCNRYPNNMAMNKLLLHTLDVPLMGEWLESNYKLGGGEVYDFWRMHAKGFDVSPKDLCPEDVTQEVKSNLPMLFAQTLTSRRQRFTTKLTGWPRIGYLNEIFPNALFIHVARDGRAVANSYLNVFFWRGWEGPDSWRWGPLTADQEARWNAVGNTPVGLAGLNWEILMDATDRARHLVSPERYLEIRYADMCADPRAVFEQALAFCDLPWTPRFERHLNKTTFKNTNEKYRKMLDANEVKVLESILAEPLARYRFV